MMNFDEMREIVAFMKENGLCELEYTDKHTSVKLRLAPPEPSFPGRFGRRPVPVAQETPAEDADVTPAEEEGINIDIDVNGMMRKAARKAADGMETVAAYVKSRLPDEDDEAEEVPEAEEEPEVPETEEESPAEEETGAKQPLKHAGEAVVNTVKAGAYLGRAGVRRGKERLSGLFRPDVKEEEPEDFVLPEEDEKKE